MGFLLDAEATRSTLLSVDTTLSANIDATQDYIPVTSTAGFSTSVVAEIETTNEVVSFDDISANYQIYSQDLTQSNWSKARATIIANDGTAPDGTVTADLLTTDGSSGTKIVVDFAIITPTANSVWATSWFVKDKSSAASEPKAKIELGSGANNGLASINLTTGAVSNVTANGTVSNCSASTTSFGDGWFRVEMVVTFGASWTGNANFGMYNQDTGTTGTSVGILLWGSQLEEATSASTYLPTTSAVLVGLTGVTRGVNGTTAASATSGDAIQQLPFSFQGVTENGSSTLSENIDASQDYIPVASTSGFATGVDATIESTNEVVSFADISSNLILYSQTYSNAYWTKAASTVTANATTAPDGTTTASKLNETAATTQFRVLRDSLVSGSAASKTFTWSCSFKKAERTAVRIEIYADTQAVESTAMFDLSNGTVGYTANVDSTAITSQGDDWYRCSLTRTMGATASALRVYHMPATGTSHGDQIYAGNPSNGIYLWGSQLEEASSPSTYLPTTTTALVGLTGVTRGVNGTTAASALSGATISQAPSLTSIGMSLRLRALSVSSDGTGAGRLTLCNNNGDTLCDVDIPDDRVYTLEFGGGIVFPNGIFISNTDNITSYTLYTDKFSGNRLTAGA